MWLGHHFQGRKVKGQGHRAALLTATFGAAVTVRMYWAWETTATLRLFGGARSLGAQGGGAEAYRVPNFRPENA